MAIIYTILIRKYNPQIKKFKYAFYLMLFLYCESLLLILSMAKF